MLGKDVKISLVLVGGGRPIGVSDWWIGGASREIW